MRSNLFINNAAHTFLGCDAVYFSKFQEYSDETSLLQLQVFTKRWPISNRLHDVPFKKAIMFKATTHKLQFHDFFNKLVAAEIAQSV